METRGSAMSTARQRVIETLAAYRKEPTAGCLQELKAAIEGWQATVQSTKQEESAG